MAGIQHHACGQKVLLGCAAPWSANGLTQTLPQRVFYAGPMFRYERPQAGRYRQFHQIGAELIGPSEPLADAEIDRAVAGDILASTWESAADVVLEVNTLGDMGKAAPPTALR